jgi:hypothetical protein
MPQEINPQSGPVGSPADHPAAAGPQARALEGDDQVLAPSGAEDDSVADKAAVRTQAPHHLPDRRRRAGNAAR